MSPKAAPAKKTIVPPDKSRGGTFVYDKDGTFVEHIPPTQQPVSVQQLPPTESTAAVADEIPAPTIAPSADKE